MPSAFPTAAEARALTAEDLPAFRSFSLKKARAAVEEALSLFGRQGLFSEYTVHDITHVDSMLQMCDWLIPKHTQPRLTPADWLLIVLSIYFHDLGLLVTRTEYDSRDAVRVDEFRREVLENGEAGTDFAAKMASMRPEERNRFVYQEFVRAKHAARIRAWINGEAPPSLGHAEETRDVIVDLVAGLPDGFRADLGLVCESHHLDDLGDVSKYPIEKPYGSGHQSIANVQHAALLLRTTDLLHITNTRTPSVMYRLINPTDPVSQEEWAKQMAVVTVKDQLARDDEGRVDRTAPRDTVEVFAEFTNEAGFFALTSYLTYAQAQLRQSFDWAAESVRMHGSQFSFPWRYINADSIQTKGFLKRPFSFTIDQTKVLDLLTGHTLYNNPSVVVRELVQNSLDAIRLQEYLDVSQSGRSVPSGTGGCVEIRWSTPDRLLSVRDNGTGMTQEVIENNLLRVGASKYRDPTFLENHPGFTAISQFGIGILSTFMLADWVEILTVSPFEDQARKLSLRSVHGKYLMRLLDKETDEEAKNLAPHGTEVRVRVRPSVQFDDVLSVVREWVVLPSSRVTVQVDDGDIDEVGYATLAEALASILHERGIETLDETQIDKPKDRQVVIRSASRGPFDLAYAVRWSEHFKEWDFVRLQERDEEQESVLLGTCVEGIRVDDMTPGFGDTSLAVLANARGPEAPRTNVARSGFESDEERKRASKAAYEVLCSHIASEVDALQQHRGFSQTWAAREGRWMSRELLSNYAVDDELLIEAASDIKVLVLDTFDGRRLVSPRELRDESVLWTIDSAFFRSAEELLSELKGTASLAALQRMFEASEFDLPDAPVVSGHSPPLATIDRLFGAREPSRIVIRTAQRRADIAWTVVRGNAERKWVRLDLPLRRRSRRLMEEAIRESFGYGHFGRNRGFGRVMIAPGDLDLEGRTIEVALRALGTSYILPGWAGYDCVRRVARRFHDVEPSVERDLANVFVVVMLAQYVGQRSTARGDARTIMDRVWARLVSVHGELDFGVMDPFVDVDELADVLGNTNWNVFDASSWQRSVFDDDTWLYEGMMNGMIE